MKTQKLTNHVPSKFLAVAACTAMAAAQSTTFAAKVLDFRFNEGSGTTTSNSGTSAGTGTFAVSSGKPFFSTNIPTGAFAPTGNVSSVDFGTSGDGGRAIDFTAATALPTFGVQAFTLTGWLNVRSTDIGPGGNRIISTWPLSNTGFEVVQESDGRLRFSVNEAPDFPGPGPFSSSGKLTIDLATDAANWLFFAVTYNAGNLGDPSDGQAKFYFGNGSTLATFDLAAAYDRGAVNSPAGSGTLTVGNFTTDVAGGRGDGSRALRGLADEMTFHDSELSLSQIQALQIVPEPASALLLTLGLAGLAARRKRHA